MSALIDSFINGEVRGHQEDSLYVFGEYAPFANVVPPIAPEATLQPALVERGNPSNKAVVWSVDELVDQEVIGWSGPSLDGFTPLLYRNDRPGFGGFNSQPMQSGPANFSPGVVPSEEAGTGKPWGPLAHMPVVQGVNPTRSTYAYQGVFADGQDYPNMTEWQRQHDGHSNGPRPAAWTSALFGRGQDPKQRRLSQWPGSTVVETPQTMSLAEALGRWTDSHNLAWGLQ